MTKIRPITNLAGYNMTLYDFARIVLQIEI